MLHSISPTAVQINMSSIHLKFSPITKSTKDTSSSQPLKNSLSELFYTKETLLKKKSPKKPKKLAALFTFNTEDHHRKSSSVSKQMTVNGLLNKTEPREASKTERSEETFGTLPDKWKDLQHKVSETLLKLPSKPLETLKQAIEQAFDSCYANPMIPAISKLSLLDSFFSIFSSFRIVAQEIISQTHSFKSKLDQHVQETQKLKQEFTKHKEEPIQEKKTEPKSPLQKPPKFQSQDKLKSQFELEKVKLLEKINILEQHLNMVTTQSNSEKLMSEISKYKNLSEDLQIKNDKLNHKIKTLTYKFQNEIGEVKIKAKEEHDFVEKFTNKAAGYELIIKSLENEKRADKEKIDRGRERLAMLSEDFYKLQGYREKCKKAQDLANALKLKFNQLELEVISGNSQKKSDTSNFVSFKGPLFEKLQSLIPLPDTEFTSSYSDTNSFILSGPTFAGLLDLAEEKFTIEPQYPNWLEVHIRGIYDSKHTEHLLSTLDTARTPSRFPDFVFNWLSKFSIDDKTRLVTELEWWKRENTDTIRVKFLAALKSSNTTRIWELYTFQEFFTERLLLDELAFFLHCRQLLFKGPQLNTTQGKFGMLNYVEQEHLSEVIDAVLHKLSLGDRVEIKMQILTKARSQGSGNGVETGFALILLLEYYVREKKAKFLGLAQSFDSAPVNTFGEVTFKTFFSICSGMFVDVPEELVIKMFRTAWVVGNGRVSCQSFLVSAHETCFFYYALQMRGNYKPAKLNENKEIRDSREHRLAKEAYEVYLRNRTTLNMVKEAVKGLGVSFLSDSLSRLEELMQRQFQEPLEYYNGLQLHEVFSRLWRAVIQVMIVYEETHQKYMSGIRNAVDLTKSTETFSKILQGLLLNRVTTKVAIRKIQKIWKQRAKKAVAITATVIKSITMFKRKLKK